MVVVPVILVGAVVCATTGTKNFAINITNIEDL
jgi:hypothetical protein